VSTVELEMRVWYGSMMNKHEHTEKAEAKTQKYSPMKVSTAGNVR